MKNFMSSLFFTLLFASIMLAANGTPIFRTIRVGAGDRTISLGEDLSKVEDLLVKTEKGYKLKPHTFGGAKTINIYLSKANRVRAIYFEYEADKDFEKMVASYTKGLGEPSTRQSFTSQAIQLEVDAWEDQETRFEIVKRVEQDNTFIFSALFDKKVASK